MKFLILFCIPKTVDVVQSVRTSDCGSEGRGFESHLPPIKKSVPKGADLFFPALKACFCKQGKTKTILPQAKRTFLMKLILQGSPSKQSEDGNPIFHPMFFQVSYYQKLENSNMDPAPKFGAICAKPDLRKFLPFEDMYPYKRSKIDCKSSAKSLPVKV